MGFHINVNENRYRDDHYRVSVAHPESLSHHSVGIGTMGSGKWGLLDEREAKHVARQIRLRVDLAEYDEVTQELRDRLDEVFRDAHDEWQEATVKG